MNQKKIKKNNNITENVIISKYLTKLNFNKSNVFNFKNDASIIRNLVNKELVISQDTLLENTHFFSKDSAKSIALKSIRTNLSDLMSMGAKPYAYTMSLSLNNKINHNWLKIFISSLYKEQKKHNFYLLGGDIINSQYISITITILGTVDKKMYVTRSGAKINDDIWVTGNIGDSYIGLKILKNKIYIREKKIRDYFKKLYYFPNVPVIIGKKLIKFMSSAIDISDGFYGDLEKITLDFKKGAKIYTKLIPFSKNSKKLVKKGNVTISELLSGGDDYQLLFTSNPRNRSKIYKLCKDYRVKITKIGKIHKSKILNFENYHHKNNSKNYIHKI